MAKKMTRRDFLMAALSAVGGLTLLEIIQKVTNAQAWRFQKHVPLVSPGLDPSRTPTPTSTSTATPTPTVTSTPTATTTASPIPELPPLPDHSIVTHVRNTSATNWAGPSSGTAYWQHVNQGAVNTMVETGLKNVTGESTVSASWDYLFRRINEGGYQSGQKVAIKVNMNCARYGNGNCDNHSLSYIDALPQVVLGLVDSLHSAGVAYNDIYIYDATTSAWDTPTHGNIFYNFFRNQFSGKSVHFVGENACSGISGTTYGKHPSLTVNFASAFQAKGLQKRVLADTLYDAVYLINIPILKSHGSADTDTGFSTAFKNHLGSINYVRGNGTPDNIHSYIMPKYTEYDSKVENPMVSIYKNPHIGGKTILTVLDGLFGGWFHNPLNEWAVFGNEPANSLLFAVDAVALDCVAADILRSDPHNDYYQGNEIAMNYLKQAAAQGLGRFESRYPYDGSDKYTTIVYNRINMS